MEEKLNVTVQFSVGERKKIEKCLEKIGIDLNIAVKMFLKKIVETQRFPFDINSDGHGIRRKVDKLGRVTIPREFLKVLDINPGEHVETFISGDIVYYKKMRGQKTEAVDATDPQ